MGVLQEFYTYGRWSINLNEMLLLRHRDDFENFWYPLACCSSGQCEYWCAKSFTHANLRSGAIKMESDDTIGHRATVHTAE